MELPLVCHLCCIPFDVDRIRKWTDDINDAIAFDGPGQRRSMPGTQARQGRPGRELSPDSLEFEERLQAQAAAKTEENMKDLLGGEEYCNAKGCRHIGIAPDSDPFGHYAGPDCFMKFGYNGFKVAVEEMLERSQLHCLRHREQLLTSNTPLEVAELHRLCFLIEDGSWETLSNKSQLQVPPAEKADLPMHPSCFEIFKRVSMRRLGKIDIDGLWMFRDHYGNLHNDLSPKDPWTADTSRAWTRFDGLPQPTDLGIVLEYVMSEANLSPMEYSCQPGTEYLATDPMSVPGLESLIQSGSEGRTSDIVFKLPKDEPPTPDVFSKLPIELRRMIAEALPSKDFGNLRIASAAFTEVPQSYFHNRIKREMPWVWEIDSAPLPANEVNWFGLWTKLASADGGSYEDEKKRVWARRQLRQLKDRVERMLEGEETGENQASMYEQAMESGKEHIMKQFRALKDVGMWKNDKNATELRGLRNRRRIYCDVEEMLTRIRELRIRDDTLSVTEV